MQQEYRIETDRGFIRIAAVDRQEAEMLARCDGYLVRRGTSMQIDKITLIFSKYGPDVALLYTNLPPSMWPYQEGPPLKLDMAAGTGAKYLEENFPGVPVKVIEA